jgi:hypothetical protein
MKEVKEIVTAIETKKVRSAWNKGVKEYALELLEGLQEGIEGGYIIPENLNKNLLEHALLNGASDWSAYSYGGCSLIYDGDIAERLSTPSFLKARRGGEWNPNKYETWLDVQARALKQACRWIKLAAF